MTFPQLTIQCHNKGTAPRAMTSNGYAVADRQFAYFAPCQSYDAYSYHLSTEKWGCVQNPQDDNSYHHHPITALAIIEGDLTIATSDSSYRLCANTVQQDNWLPGLLPLCRRRVDALVSASNSEYFFVFVWNEQYQFDEFIYTAEVELLEVCSQNCHKLTNLLHPLPDPSAVICGDQLYVIGSDATGYSCSLKKLLSLTDKPITSECAQTLISWTPLPPLPVKNSTAATLSGQLVIVGGISTQEGSPVNSIHQLFNGEWMEIGSMCYRRSKCAVVCPSPNKIIIVGGEEAKHAVEECVLV